MMRSLLLPPLEEVGSVAAVDAVVAVAALGVDLEGAEPGVGGERVIAGVHVEVQDLHRAGVDVEQPGRGRGRERAVEDHAPFGPGLTVNVSFAVAPFTWIVDAVAALVEVVVVAAVPDDRVVARVTTRVVGRRWPGRRVVVRRDAVVAVAAREQVAGVALPSMVSLPSPPSTSSLKPSASRPPGDRVARVHVEVEDLHRAGVDVEQPGRSRGRRAVEDHATVDGVDGERLVRPGAVDLDRVQTGAALVEVVVVAAVPDDRVVAGVAARRRGRRGWGRRVVVRGDPVVVVAAVDPIGMLGADDRSLPPPPLR